MRQIRQRQREPRSACRDQPSGAVEQPEPMSGLPALDRAGPLRSRIMKGSNMTNVVTVKARDLCLGIAALLVLELASVVAISGNLVAGLAAVTMAGVAFLSSKRLADPSESLDFSRAALLSLPPLLVGLAGIGIAIHQAHGWTTWLCVAAGYIVGNRLKAAGPHTVAPS